MVLHGDLLAKSAWQGELIFAHSPNRSTGAASIVDYECVGRPLNPVVQLRLGGPEANPNVVRGGAPEGDGGSLGGGDAHPVKGELDLRTLKLCVECRRYLADTSEHPSCFQFFD